jgi:hypothetical protein
MHPEILRQVAAERHQDAIYRARQNRIAKALRVGRRSRNVVAEEIVLPAIPDYVDGTFRSAEEVTAQVPATRTAA